jgi:hypothetical protein
MLENIDQIHNNFYSILLRMYNNNNMELGKRNQIPCILATISLVLNDRHKVDELINKFGFSVFTTVIGPWGQWVLRQIYILPESTRPNSPTNIQDIDTEISINSTN